DQHFSQRSREGRTGVFLGRIMKDWNKVPRAIAVDERTAVCIDESGMAEVLGTNKAFFIKTEANKAPETFAANSSVTWNHNGQALHVSAMSAAGSSNKFNMNTFEPESTAGLEKFWWAIVSGNWVQAVRQ